MVDQKGRNMEAQEEVNQANAAIETSKIERTKRIYKLFNKLYTDDSHPMRVRNMCTTEEEEEVALFHDAVEDSLCTYSDLVEAGLTTKECLAIALLDKRGADCYEDYIKNIARQVRVGHEHAILAAKVKVYDIMDHLDPVRIKNITYIKLGDYVSALEELLTALQEQE